MPVSTVSIPVGQWLVSAEGTRWWFDSGSLALDFATTGSIGGTGIAARADRLHTPDDLSAWLRERFPVAIGVARTRDLFDAISLRDAVGRMAIRASTGEAPSTADIDVVNLYAATPDVPPSIAGGSRQVGPLGAHRAAGIVDHRARCGRPVRPGERGSHPAVLGR